MLLFCSLEVVGEVAVISSHQKKMRVIRLPAKDNVANGTTETMARATQACSEFRLSVLSATLTCLRCIFSASHPTPTIPWQHLGDRDS